MNSKFTIKDICEKIWQLEDNYNLLDYEIKGVKIWQYLRYKIYVEISKDLAIFNQAHTEKYSNLDLVRAFPHYLYNSITKNPLFGNYTKNILVFDHNRKILVNDEYADIYTKYLIEEFDDIEYEILENPYIHRHFVKNDPLRKYLDYAYLSYYPKSLFLFKFTSDQKYFINKITSEINTYFGISLDIEGLFSKYLRIFLHFYDFYNRLIKKRKYKKIYLVVSYGPVVVPLTAAAKNNGVQVIELQHGVIGPYHLGYNYPNHVDEIKYFPDIFYSFGDYWKETVNLPISNKNIVTYGYPYMREMIEKYKHLPNKTNQILFISQGAIGLELSRFAYHLAEKLDNYKIIYKLHPGEYDRWKAEYAELVAASNLDNVEVIDNNGKNLYEYLAESPLLVGVFSTAVYEGLSFKCKTFLVDLPGIEHMQYLIDKGIVKKVTNPDDLLDSLETFEPSPYDEEYFFRSV